MIIDTKTAIWAETSKTADANLISALHPLKGVGEVEWVVGAAVFLASADATWVTGTNLSVDGGFTAK